VRLEFARGPDPGHRRGSATGRGGGPALGNISSDRHADPAADGDPHSTADRYRDRHAVADWNADRDADGHSVTQSYGYARTIRHADP
jgi:hypothetical protein